MKGCMAPDLGDTGTVDIRPLRGNMDKILNYWSASYSLVPVKYLTALGSAMLGYCVCRSALGRGLEKGKEMGSQSQT